MRWMGLKGRISGGGEGKGVPGRRNGRSKGMVGGKFSRELCWLEVRKVLGRMISSACENGGQGRSWYFRSLVQLAVGGVEGCREG